MDVLVDLDSACGRTLRYRDLIECGNTWSDHSTRGSPIDNVPRQPGTFDALRALCESVIDPMADALGAPVLSYGFASPRLTSKITKGIAPRLDQHASCELRDDGRLVCDRRGAAVDFSIAGRSALDVARWIAEHTDFDRIYLYGSDRPLHVSFGPQASKAIYEMVRSASGAIVPRRFGG